MELILAPPKGEPSLPPREKMAEFGVESLSDTELLAVLLRTGYGGLNVGELSRHLLAEFGSRGLFQFRTVADIQHETGLPPVKACTLLAAGEYLRRLQRKDSTPIRSSEEFYGYVRGDFIKNGFEQLRIVCVDSQRRVLYGGLIAQGEPESLKVGLAAVLHHPIRLNGRHFYLAHNHPGGLPEPSPEDIAFTENVRAESLRFGLSFDDHLILGEEGFYSFALRGFL